MTVSIRFNLIHVDFKVGKQLRPYNINLRGENLLFNIETLLFHRTRILHCYHFRSWIQLSEKKLLTIYLIMGWMFVTSQCRNDRHENDELRRNVAIYLGSNLLYIISYFYVNGVWYLIGNNGSVENIRPNYFYTKYPRYSFHS